MNDQLDLAKMNLVLASKKLQLATNAWSVLRNSEGQMAKAMHVMGVPRDQAIAFVQSEIHRAKILREARLEEFKLALKTVGDLEPDLDISPMLDESENTDL